MGLKTILRDLYAPFGNEWVKQNDYVFTCSKRCGLALAGSLAIAVGRKKAIKPPGDIDFVCDSTDTAQKFISELQKMLFKRAVYWRILVNSKTQFCPEGCAAHFRIIVPFWLPICVMVIGEVSHWRVDGGDMIQSFDDVVKAAKLLDERDGKGRVEELQVPESCEPRQVVHRIIPEGEPIDFMGATNVEFAYSKKAH